MSAIATKHLQIHSLPEITTPAKIAMCYIAAHLSAISVVGVAYLLGIFDVGFLAPESFAVKLFEYLTMVH